MLSSRESSRPQTIVPTLGVSLLFVFVLPSCSASTPEVVGDPSDDDEQDDDPDGAVPSVAARGGKHRPSDSNGRLSHQSLLLMICTSGSFPANLKLTVSAWSLKVRQIAARYPYTFGCLGVGEPEPPPALAVRPHKAGGESRAVAVSHCLG